MAENKTKPTNITPRDFINTVEHSVRQQDALQLLTLFEDVSGFPPVMWGGSIIGYGTYQYTLANGRQETFMRTGFSPRKQNMSLYIMSGYSEYQEQLARLGKHKHGKSCLYVNKLADIDLEVLKEMISLDLAEMARRYPEGA